MKATCLLGPATTSPRTFTTPAEGRVKPAPMLSSVLLPQPEGPISETTSPGCMDKLTWRAAKTSAALPRAAKRLSTPRNSMAGTAATFTSESMPPPHSHLRALTGCFVYETAIH